MRVSPGLMTFIVGLVILAIAGVFYQQSLISSGAVGTGGSGAVVQTAQANVKYACPMRCVEADQPGECPVCGMEMMPIELATAAPAATRADAGAGLYTCPMHPQIEQDHPGTCPICGMELVPKQDDDTGVDPATRELVSAVSLSPLQAVLADVEPVHPERRQMEVSVDAIGEVSLPEDQVNTLASWQAGRVENLLLRETGGYIAKGAHILDIYSEELVQAQEEYLLAQRAVSQLGDSGYESISGSTRRLLSAAHDKLKRLGMTGEQIDALGETGTVVEYVSIDAQHGGTVMEKFVSEGMYVREGERMFTVADLSSVWIEVEVYERDMAQLSVGKPVTMLCPIHPGMVFTGYIELIEPSLDTTTRTHTARVVVDNRDFILRPGMIMDAQLTIDYGEMLLLPRNAILHTGDGDLVYAMVGDNQWEPREVTTGHDFGDYVQITSGLGADEAVAGTAVFLLDSEAQLKGVPRPTDASASGGNTGTAGGQSGHAH